MIKVINNNKSEVGDDQRLFISQMHPAGVVFAQIMDTKAKQEAAGGKKMRRKKRKKSKTCTSSGGDGSREAAWRKRKLTEQQVSLLELNFGNEHKLESGRKERLAGELGLDPRQVAVWFQNRRARWKAKKLEEEYSWLKAAHDSLLLHNSQLESQVIKLEELLAGTEMQVTRLSSEVTSSNSPTSSLSVEALGAPFLGGFGIIEEGNLQNKFNMAAESFVPGAMEWANMYDM